MPDDIASTSELYRAPMRSRRAEVDSAAAVERALRRGVCGIDGIISPPPSTLCDAVERAAVQHDERLARRIARFADAPVGSLVWTRDGDGLFWLGMLASGWSYDDSRAAADAGLVHVRDCRWVAQPVDERLVPAAVIATFARGGRNWQRTHSEQGARESAGLWRRLS